MKGIHILERIGAHYDLARAVLTEAQVRAASSDRSGATVAMGNATVNHIQPASNDS
jgi:hypothetical protein